MQVELTVAGALRKGEGKECVADAFRRRQRHRIFPRKDPGTETGADDARVARVPLSAILNRGSGPSVYAIDRSGALALRPVTVASFTEDAALVTSGINEGEAIVTLGVQKLEAGLKVRTVEAR